MRYILIILSLLILTGCNPFISKELRRKNKANRKLERLTNKYPELLTQDTIYNMVAIEAVKVEIDSFIVIQKDTAIIDSLVNLIENKETRKVIKEYITNYVPFKDTTIHLIDGFKVSFYAVGGNIHYTIDKPSETLKKKVRTLVPKVSKVELTIIEQAQNLLSKLWRWFIFIILAIILYKFVIKFLSK